MKSAGSALTWKSRSPPSGPGLIRAVDYTVPDRDGTGEVITLVTTLTDPHQVSALALAGAYAQRWEAETGFDVVKTTVRGPVRVLRSRLPELVTQEIWALLLPQYALGRPGRPRR